jgi:nitrogen fixation NifU-like protein
MSGYSDVLLDHFTDPRNAGAIEDPDGVATVTNPACGDVMRLYLKIDHGVITDAKWQTQGCGTAIAASSVASEMIAGQSVEQARKMTRVSISDALGGLTPAKMHCSVLAADALREALGDYADRRREPQDA